MRNSLIGSVVLVAVIAGVCCAQEAPAPLAHWKMDGVAEGKVADATGNGHDAVLGPEGVALAVVDSPCGKALAFDGKQSGAYLQIEKWEDLDNLQQLTVMAWIKPAERSMACEILCGKGDKSGDPPWPGWRFRYGWAMVSFALGGPGEQHGQVSTPAFSVPVGYFSHVAATYDGQKLRLYVNCVLMAEAEAPAQLAPSKRAYIIANYLGRKDAYPFHGVLDELKVFDRALSEEEIFAQASSDMPQ